MSRSAVHTRDQCSSTTTLPRVGDVLSAAMLCSILNDVRTRQRRHLATVHGIWGVVQGLRVRVMSSDDDGRPSVDVERGALLDSSGRLRTLTETTTLGVPPSGPGPWRVVGEFPTDDGPISPRWAAVTQGESPVDSTRKSSWRDWQAGGNLDFSFRPTASAPRRALERPARFFNREARLPTSRRLEKRQGVVGPSRHVGQSAAGRRRLHRDADDARCDSGGRFLVGNPVVGRWLRF